MLKIFYRKVVNLTLRKIIWNNIIKYFVGGRIFYFQDYLIRIKNYLKKQIFDKTKFLRPPHKYSYYAGNEQILTKINTGQIMVVRRDDNSTAPHLLLSGQWEPYITSCSERFIKNYRSPTIFDVGANFGWYGLTLSRLSDESQIHYFEANNLLIDCIKRTTIVNGLEHRSKINHNAVSDVSGEKLKLNVLNHLQGSSSIEPLEMGLFNQTSTFYGSVKEPFLIEVESITIDKYADDHYIQKIDFLKIDVEGHEENVIEGASKLLQKSKDMTLLLEWNTNRYSNKMLKRLADFEILLLIDDNNYKVINCNGIHRSCKSVDAFEKKLCFITDYKSAHFDLIFTSKMMLSLSNLKTKSKYF